MRSRIACLLLSGLCAGLVGCGDDKAKNSAPAGQAGPSAPPQAVGGKGGGDMPQPPPIPPPPPGNK